MSIYKQAIQQKVRFTTNRGVLTPEQMFDLPLGELDALAVKLEQEHKDSGGKSFLDKKTPKDKIIKLKFKVVLDILETKSEEANAATEAAENKAHNEKILELIAGKEDEALAGKSIKQLKAMLK